MEKIKRIILVSGKRKCGKDFFSENLQKRFGARSQIVRISAPIKKEWAEELKLDLAQLLSDGPYKEQYRREMILWSDEVRARDYGYFCRAAMQEADAEIIIVSDIRRQNDIKYFRETYGDRVKAIRLTCPETIRAERGWIYTDGVDNVASECGLDGYVDWDLVLENNNQMDGKQIVDLILNGKFEI